MSDSNKAFRDYLQQEKNYSAHTVNGYLQDLYKFQYFIEQTFSQNSDIDVNYSQIRSWIVSLIDNKISNTAVNRKIASLKAYYKFLLKTKQIQISPLLTHKALKTPKIIQIPFSELEVDNVLNAMTYSEDFDGTRDKLVIDMFYTTGIRRSELINLKLNNVDLNNATLKVLGKRNKERIIPIIPIVATNMHIYLTQRSQLENIKDYDYFFLTKTGNKMSESFVYRLINSYFGNVSEKVKKSPHMLRHTFATHLLNNGADLNSVKELLGHSSLASTQVYTHNSLSELKKVYQNAHPRS